MAATSAKKRPKLSRARRRSGPGASIHGKIAIGTSTASPSTIAAVPDDRRVTSSPVTIAIKPPPLMSPIVDQTLKVPSSSELRLKTPEEFRYIGKGGVPLVDGSDIVTGRAQYGIDPWFKDMGFAVIARSPVLGGKAADPDRELVADADRLPAPGGLSRQFVPFGIPSSHHPDQSSINPVLAAMLQDAGVSPDAFPADAASTYRAPVRKWRGSRRRT